MTDSFHNGHNVCSFHNGHNVCAIWHSQSSTWGDSHCHTVQPMGSREDAGTGSFRWSFLELGFKIHRYYWLKIVYLPQQWMVRLDAGNEQLCESISSFWATLPRQNGRLWLIYRLIALIIGNGGWLDSHMFRNTKMSLWKSGTFESEKQWP